MLKNVFIGLLLVAIWGPILYCVEQVMVTGNYEDHNVCIKGGISAELDGTPLNVDHRGCFTLWAPYGTHRLTYRTQDGRAHAVDLVIDERSAQESVIEVRDDKVMIF